MENTAAPDGGQVRRARRFHHGRGVRPENRLDTKGCRRGLRCRGGCGDLKIGALFPQVSDHGCEDGFVPGVAESVVACDENSVRQSSRPSLSVQLRVLTKGRAVVSNSAVFFSGGATK